FWIESLYLRTRFSCFFQAEDGIRDRNVTGVQTCALPISASTAPAKTKKSADGAAWTIELVQNPDILAGLVATRHPGQVIIGFAEIGRASCRESEKRAGVEDSRTKKHGEERELPTVE